MRIKVVRPASKQNTDVDYQQHSIKVLKSYASPGTDIDVVFPEAGPEAGPMLGRFCEARVASGAPFVIYEVAKAEKEGYDGVYMTGEWDVGAEVARHLVRIPVVDTGPLALHVGALLGSRVCLLIIEDAATSFARKLLKRWGMSHFVTSIKAWNISPADIWRRRHDIKDLTIKICKEAVEREDAEVIVPYCGVFVPFAVPTEEIEAAVGVPVINGVALGLRTTEMFVNLKLSHSEKTYPYTPGGLALFSYARPYSEVAGVK